MQRTSVSVLALLGFGLSTAFAGRASAQGEGGVAGSGMADGGASITTRADVELSLESGPHTGAARVEAWGRAMGGRVAVIRTCYEGVVAERPTVEGTMRVLLGLPERGAMTMEVSEDTPSDAALTRCVQRALRETPQEELHRPSSVYAVLRFSNTASRSAEASAVAAAAADVVTVSREGGVPSVGGDAREGLVRWVVRGAADASDELVAEGFRTVRSGIPGLLDCRRRAGRRGRDPSGVLVLSLRLRTAHAPTPTVRSTTVSDPTAGRCLTQRLGRTPHHSAVSGTVEVEVTFSP